MFRREVVRELSRPVARWVQVVAMHPLGIRKKMNIYICTKDADQPTKQSATPHRLFHVPSVEPLWLKMTHLKNMQDALFSITERIV